MLHMYTIRTDSTKDEAACCPPEEVFNVDFLGKPS
jgi:hypothetical protein